MKVIPMVTLKATLKYACALTHTDIHTDNIIYDIPLMANTNIMTGYAYTYL